MRLKFITLAAALTVAACGSDDSATTIDAATVDAAVAIDAAVDAPIDAVPAPPSISIAATGAIAEGNAGTATGAVQVTLSRAATTPVTVNYASASGTAIAPDDYASVGGTVTFPAGTTVLPITIDVSGDTLDEDDETLTLTLGDPQGAILGAASSVVTITDDDSPPTIAVGPVTAAESSAAGLAFVVSLSTASSKSIMVSYATANGTASAADYTAATGMLTFAPGETAKSVVVALTADPLDEPDETVQLNLSAPVNATIMTAQGIGTITDDDPAPALSIDDVSLAEGNAGNTTLTFPVTLAAASGNAVSVMYATTAGTATAGTDYTTTSGTLNIAAGMTTGMINVTVAGDVLSEPDETFTVTLSMPTNAVLAVPTALGTILNDDGGLPTLSIADIAIAEGNAGNTPLTFTVTLSAAAGGNVTVAYATANNTAVDTPGVGGTDYTPVSGTLTFTPGQLTRTLVVQVVGDVNDEANESFRVNLSAATGASIARAQALGTITDDDATPTLAVAPVTVAESAATAPFTVTLSAASGRQVTVNYATADGTAIVGGAAGAGGQDYNARSGGLTFAPGELTKTVAVTINGDALDEPDETFALTLSGAVNATIMTATANATVTDNDPPPNITIDDVSQLEGTGPMLNAVIPVRLSSASGRQVTVAYATAPGTAPVATAGVDYTQGMGTLTFAPGQITQNVTVALAPDAANEPSEKFAIMLSGAVNATIVDNIGEVTIVNDDSPLPNISIGNAPNVTETAAAGTMMFQVALSSPSATPVTVNYATVAGASTATAGLDYTATSGTLTFAANELLKTVTVPVLVDVLDEQNEIVTMQLSGNSPNSNLLVQLGQGTIVDDDAPASLSVVNMSYAEGNAGPGMALVTVNLSAPSGKTITVNYSTGDGTASSASGLGLDDYDPHSGSLTFPPGTVSATLPVLINGDRILEANETFQVGLSAPVNATLLASVGTETITNDDAAPTLTITGGMVAEGPLAIGNVLQFTITLSAPSLAQVTVVFSTANGTAVAGSDYFPVQNLNVTFPPGTTSVTRGVTLNGDNVVEGNETFTGNLSNPVNATIMTAAATGTILNDD